ncbi:CBS domain-containing protein [Dactylosporangium aurantiacum]|nr:CBS domain-containing protein [Dactylosporangium aurantiacum]MDG6109951.1 CBS domain-containing protein [Dactylosporangium aurantiacum]
MNEQVKDIMTSGPVTIDVSESVAAAAELMREADVGALVVTDTSGVRGILTDRDVTVRVVAAGCDPATTAVGDVVAPDLVAVSPQDDLDTAVELMRTNALRRLPVLDGERLVGIVSLGDLAIERDATSALADISAQAPNH